MPEFDVPVFVTSYLNRTVAIEIEFHLKQGSQRPSFIKIKEEFPDYIFKYRITPDKVNLTIGPGETKRISLHIILESKVAHWTLIAVTRDLNLTLCSINYHVSVKEMPLKVELAYIFTSIYYLILEALYLLRWGRWRRS